MDFDYSALNKKISNIDILKAIHGYMTKDWLYTFVYVLCWLFFFIFSLSFLVLISSQYEYYGIFGMIKISIPLILFISAGFFVFIRYAQSQKILIQSYNFAQDNRVDFIKNRRPYYKGLIFGLGENRTILQAYLIDEIEIGDYKYDTYLGKNEDSHYYGYVKIKLPKTLPHLLLDSRDNNYMNIFSNLPRKFSSSQIMQLEGDFNNYFTLYVPKGYEKDLLYLFTPDVMQALIKGNAKYDIEIIKDELYLYKNGSIGLNKENELRGIFEIIDLIKKELFKQASSYKNERLIIDNSYTQEKPSMLNKSWNKPSGAFGLFIALILVLYIPNEYEIIQYLGFGAVLLLTAYWTYIILKR